MNSQYSVDGSVRVWNLDDGKLGASFQGDEAATCMVMADAETFVCGSLNGAVTLPPIRDVGSSRRGRRQARDDRKPILAHDRPAALGHIRLDRGLIQPSRPSPTYHAKSCDEAAHNARSIIPSTSASKRARSASRRVPTFLQVRRGSETPLAGGTLPGGASPTGPGGRQAYTGRNVT